MTEERFLRPAEVADMTTLSPTEIKRRIAEERFPSPIKLGPQRSAFLLTEVQAWMKEQVEQFRSTNYVK